MRFPMLVSFADAGADAAFAIIPDHAWAGLSIDGAFNTLPGFGLEVGVRVGLSAAL